MLGHTMAEKIAALEKRLGTDTEFETVQKRVTTLEEQMTYLKEELGLMNPGMAGVGASQNAGEIVPVKSSVPIDGVIEHPKQYEQWEILQRQADDARILASKKGQRVNGSPSILRIQETKQGE